MSLRNSVDWSFRDEQGETTTEVHFSSSENHSSSDLNTENTFARESYGDGQITIPAEISNVLAIFNHVAGD